MHVILTLQNNGIVDIPVNYNYLIQSEIYALLKEDSAKYAAQLHDVAFGEKTRYKFFTFGSLIGRNHFHDKKLYFEDNLSLELRSVSDTFFQTLKAAIERKQQFCIGKHHFNIMQIEYGEYNISDSLVRIRTISPIIAKIQDDNNKSVYFSPQDVRFYSRLREKFENKYKVFYGQVPESNIDMLPIGKHNKVVTKYKNTWITAYHGCFQLYGKPEHLQFLYDIGLGVKTSLGFGMFEVMQKNNC